MAEIAQPAALPTGVAWSDINHDAWQDLRDYAAAAAGPRPTRIRLNGVPISENRNLPRGTVHKLLDPVELVVWDVAWFRARVEMVQEVRDIFDRLRLDLRLPVPDRAAGRTPTPTRMQQ